MSTLGDLTVPTIDQSGPSKTGEFTYIDISSIDNKLKKIVEPKRLPAGAAPSRAKQRLQPGDVLISMTRPNRNAVAIVSPDLKGAIGSTGFHVLRPIDGIESRWLFYGVQTHAFVEAMSGLVQGALYPAVRPKDIRGFGIDAPSWDEQQYIVAEIEKQFSRLDEAVANLKRIKANLKRYKAAVLKAAVEGKLTEAWRKAHPDVEPASKLLERILTTRRAKWKGKGKYKEPAAPDPTVLPKLTKGWVWASLDHLTTQIADVDHKMPKTCEGGIPYVSTKDFTGDDDIDFAKAKRISTSDFEALCKKVRPVRGDILLSRYGTVGEVRIVSTDIAFQASYSVAILKPVAGFGSTNFVAGVLRSDIIQSQIKRDVRATAQPDLGLAHIRQFLIPLPPLKEQHQIIAEVERRMSILAELEATIEANLTRADRLRQSILGEAFSRELKISK